jgi:hypothetical protein
MDELVKTLRHFITRDIIYIIGGSSVLVSAMYYFEKLQDFQLELAGYIFFAGISYVIGYTLQDIFCLLPGFTTCPRMTPNKLQKWLYKRFNRKEWEKPNLGNKNYFELPGRITNERMLAEHDRVITLMQIGTVVSPCFFISSLFIFLKWNSQNGFHEEFDLFLFILLIAISIFQLILTNIKSMQYAILFKKFFENQDPTNQCPKQQT